MGSPACWKRFRLRAHCERNSDAKQSEANERISVQIVCTEKNTSVHTKSERLRYGARRLLRMYIFAANGSESSNGRRIFDSSGLQPISHMG